MAISRGRNPLACLQGSPPAPRFLPQASKNICSPTSLKILLPPTGKHHRNASRAQRPLSLKSGIHGKPLDCSAKKTRHKELVHGRQRSLPFVTITASWEELAGVLVFSAFPFVTVNAIANSQVGESLQQNLRARKQKAEALSDVAAADQRRARQRSPWYGVNRPRWLGPLAFDYPDHLNGDSPGDYGFDLFDLGKDPSKFDRYFNLEILHARWAMLSALGVVVPEILSACGAFGSVEPVWFRVGSSKLQGDTLDYLGIEGLHLAGGQGVIIIAICQFMLMLGPEYARYCGIEALEPLGIFLPGDINYPGGLLFDPLGLSKDANQFEDLKVKEIKNGRLAMVAWVGFALQAAITGRGPVENLLDHLGSPLGHNVVTSVSSIFQA